jgi:hypothetical protein
VLASAHAASRGELLARPHLGDLLRQGFFERVIVIKRNEGNLRTLIPAAVYDETGKKIL